MSDYPPFPGFRPSAFSFLKELKENNEREWFKARKSTFDDELKWPMECLLAEISRHMASKNWPLTSDPKKSFFRIYRDTRFSKNKDPYKTHIAGVVTPSGTRKDPGGLYIHVEPGNCFLAGGFWQLDSPALKKFRERMSDDPAAFQKQVAALDKKGLVIKPHDTPLKRMPRGFEDYEDLDIATYFKFKSFIFQRDVTQKQVKETAFVQDVLTMTEDSLSFLTWGWETLEG